MDQIALKLILIALMLVLSIIFGLTPLKLLQFLRKRAAASAKSDLDSDRRWPSLLLCLVTCFSGGVFLATCFLHLLPEVSESMQDIIKKYDWPNSYPLGELISCAGFFLVFLIEELVILCLRGHHHHHHGGGGHHNGSVVHVHVVQTPSSPSLKSGNTPTGKTRITGLSDDELDDRAELKALAPKNGTVGMTNHQYAKENGISIVSGSGNPELKTTAFPLLSPCGDLSSKISPLLPDFIDPDHCNGVALRVSPQYHNHLGHDHGTGYPSPPLSNGGDIIGFNDGSSLIMTKACQNGTTVVGSDGTLSMHSRSSVFGDDDGNCPGIELPLNAEPECCEGPCDGEKEDPPIMMAYRPHAHSHGVRSMTLVIALSVHSIIEGLAFGIQDTETQTTALFLGIIIHKCIILFSTGVQLARTHAHQFILVVATIVAVSIMSPIGAGIGLAVQEGWGHSEARDVTMMVFSGLSVGTFLYVTFFEVLIHERDNEHNNLFKLFAIFAGFVLMAALRAMEDKHSHGSGSHSHHENTTAIIGNITSTLSTTTLV